MSYFNQFEYSQSLDNSESAPTHENVEKGHKNQTQVDLTKFEEICKKFRENKDMKIKNLSGNDREDFNLAISYVNLLYGTDYYSKLFEKVRRHFDNLTSVQAGSVGAFFAGCLISNRSGSGSGFGEVPASCNLPCVDGVPLPKQEGWELCDKAVIVAERIGEGYNFSLVKPASDSETGEAYLFVETKPDFTGFTQEEKDEILAYGCKKVHVVGYTSDLSYSEISTESQPVEKLKSRKPKVKKYSHKNKNWWWIVLVAIIVLFVLFLFYRFN